MHAMKILLFQLIFMKKKIDNESDEEIPDTHFSGYWSISES